MDNEQQGVLYLTGSRGYSAYEIAVQNGFVGTEEEWLASLKGDKGDPGTPFDELTEEQKAEIKGDRGYSSYEIAVQHGYIGTEEEWVNNFLTPDGYYNKDEIDVKINKKPNYYNNVASMKADTTLKNGDMCITLGYYNANDGGGAEYKIVSSSSSYYETLNNNLLAELIVNDEVNVKQFGAYGDEIHDDSNAIQNAIDYADNIYIDKGTYLVATTINVGSNKYIHGNENTIITRHSTGNVFVNDNETDLYGIRFENLTFLGNVFRDEDSAYPRRTRTFKNNNYGNGINTAILFQGKLSQRSDVTPKVENVKIVNCKFLDIYSLPILLIGCEDLMVNNNMFDNCLDVGFVDCKKLIFDSNNITRGADNGVSISSGNDDVVCTNNIITWCADNGIWISGWFKTMTAIDPDTEQEIEMNKILYGSTNVIIDGNIVKHSGHSGIIGKWVTKNIVISNNLIDDCRFNYNGNTQESEEAGSGIFIAGYSGSTVDENGYKTTLTDFAENITITGNKILNCVRGGVYMERVIKFDISNNSFENLGAKKLPDGNDIDLSLTKYNHGIYVANYDASISAEGMITNNTFKETRSDKVVYDYTNWKYALSRCPDIKIKDNIFFDYNDAKYNITKDIKSRILLDDFIIDKFNANVLLIPNEITTIQELYDLFNNNGTYYELSWYKPYVAFFKNNIVKTITGYDETIGYGYIVRHSPTMVIFGFDVPTYNERYVGKIENGTLINLTKFTGSSVQ